MYLISYEQMREAKQTHNKMPDFRLIKMEACKIRFDLLCQPIFLYRYLNKYKCIRIKTIFVLNKIYIYCQINSTFFI